ncbi:MAG TPA: carboxypeptidase-like regulatory domain-containing protein, partial [Candidatus Acidoferrum sp.]|nr:carboxypeptidase-like regulatory domain-containing protein [Candidatus Acidoferrum sp.]
MKFLRSTRPLLFAVLLSASLSVMLLCSAPLRAQDAPPPRPTPDPASAPATRSPAPAAPDATAPSQTPSVSVTSAPQATAFEISGTVKSGKTPLPGVTVTAANTLTGKKYSVATALDGSYKFSGLARGRYVVRVEFMAFAPLTQEIVLKPDTPTGKFDAEMILASRQAEQSPAASAIAAITAGRGFQSLSVENSLSALEGTTSGSAASGGASAGDIASLPMGGAGADAANESVSISGAQGRSQDFGAGNEDELQSRIEEFRQRAVASGLIPGSPTQGGAGGGGGGFGGPGGFGGGGPIA